MTHSTRQRPTWGWRSVCAVWTAGISTALFGSGLDFTGDTVGNALLVFTSGAVAGAYILSWFTRSQHLGRVRRLLLAALGGLIAYFVASFLTNLGWQALFLFTDSENITIGALASIPVLAFMVSFLSLMFSPVGIVAALVLESAALFWETVTNRNAST